MKEGDYVLVRRPFPFSLFLKPWVGSVIKGYWPVDGLKYYAVRAEDGREYCRELIYLTPVSPLEALARTAE
jgi:hypothetical protein